MWDALVSGDQKWMAGSYFSLFAVNLLIAVMELIAWLLFSSGYPEFAYIWVPSLGYYGSMILYTVSPFMALFHATFAVLDGGLARDSDADGYANDIFLICGGFIQWGFSMTVHVMATQRFINHGHALFDECRCDTLEDTPEGATAE